MENKFIASLVFLGYPHENDILKYFFEFDEVLSVENFKPIEKYQVVGNIKAPEEFIENFRKNAPIKIYQNSDETIKITIISPEQKLIVECIKDFNTTCDKFKNICKRLIQKKSDSIFTVGLNFNEHCETQKLHLFDEDIKKIKGWNDDTGYNDGFQLVLPLKDKNNKNLTSTYTIFKENKNDEERDLKRTYIIDVNFNYNIQDQNIYKKVFLEKFINEDIDKYYKKYQENKDIILSIGQKNA